MDDGDTSTRPWPPPSPITFRASESEEEESSRQVWALYKAGTPLFTKAQLASAEEQLAGTSPVVEVVGIDGRTCDLERRTWDFGPHGGRPEVDFLPIQRLVQGTYPSVTTRKVDTAFCSVQFCCVYNPNPAPPPSPGDAEIIQRAFAAYQQAWLASKTCRDLVSMLSSIKIPHGVDKIVCFGLGHLMERHQHARSRTYVQHAAALTMANVLKQRNTAAVVGGGREIRCYFQEPEYTAACKQFLHSQGVTVLDGVKGFLKVDDATMVFTVAPNVPVKQIVADLARPAMMVWNSPLEAWMSRPERLADWVVEERELLGQACTDPDSPRTRDMLRDEYTSYPFPDGAEDFGNLEIHVKRG